MTGRDLQITKCDLHDVCMLAMEELSGEVSGNSGQMELARRLEDLNHAVTYPNPSFQSDRTASLYAVLRHETGAGDSWSKFQLGLAVIRDRLRATIRETGETRALFDLCIKLFDVTI